MQIDYRGGAQVDTTATEVGVRNREVYESDAEWAKHGGYLGAKLPNFDRGWRHEALLNEKPIPDSGAHRLAYARIEQAFLEATGYYKGHNKWCWECHAADGCTLRRSVHDGLKRKNTQRCLIPRHTNGECAVRWLKSQDGADTCESIGISVDYLLRRLADAKKARLHPRLPSEAGSFVGPPDLGREIHSGEEA